MKRLLFTITILASSIAYGNDCTAVIKDLRSNQEYESITRSSYSTQAACDIANQDCREKLSTARSEGKYQNAECVIKTPQSSPNPNVTVCLTGLFDFYYRELRTYAAPGVNPQDACNNSFNFCLADLNHYPNNYGYRCMVKGILDTSSIPPQSKSAQCTAVRLDYNGTYLQNYVSKVIGPVNTDVLALACNQALDNCTKDLKEKQACTIITN